VRRSGWRRDDGWGVLNVHAHLNPAFFSLGSA
jgi:hypothetical protein